MILVNGVGPGTYGPFSYEGGFTQISAAITGSGTTDINWTDEAGTSFEIVGVSGNPYQQQIHMAPGHLTVIVPAGTSAITITLTKIPN